MKPRIIILLVVLGAFLTSCYDESGISDAFGKYRWREGVVAFTVPGFAIRIASRVADLEKEERELLHSIDKVKVLVIDENSDSRINLHKEFYSHINTDGKYEELLVIRDHEQDVTIFGK